MMIDEPDDVETIGDDLGIGEMFLHQTAVVCRQIHAHNPYLVFALETLKIGVQGRLRTSQHHIIDFVVFQIAQSRGKAFSSGEKVLVDA